MVSNAIQRLAALLEGMDQALPVRLAGPDSALPDEPFLALRLQRLIPDPALRAPLRQRAPFVAEATFVITLYGADESTRYLHLDRILLTVEAEPQMVLQEVRATEGGALEVEVLQQVQHEWPAERVPWVREGALVTHQPMKRWQLRVVAPNQRPVSSVDLLLRIDGVTLRTGQDGRASFQGLLTQPLDQQLTVRKSGTDLAFEVAQKPTENQPEWLLRITEVP